MSFKEDFHRMLDGKTPVSDIPYSIWMPAEGSPPPGTVGVMAEIFAASAPTPGYNAWGVELAADEFCGIMPVPGKFMLTDVTKWRDVVKAPYLYDFDWAAAAERDLAKLDWDPETQVTSMFGAGGAYFLSMSYFMGFEGAMLAMYDAPEAVHEMLDYICDYDCWIIDNLIKYYPFVEVMGIGDDNATEMNPFISIPMFREFLLPRYKRLADKLKDAGKVISYHNCGRCEDFMDDMVDIGVNIWNAATPRNDLVAFKEKTGNKVILEFMPRYYADQTPEEVRQQTIEMIDKYAPGGALVWSGFAMVEELDAVITDVLNTYGKGYYAE